MNQKQQQTAKITQDASMKLVKLSIPENLTLFPSINTRLLLDYRFYQQQIQCFLQVNYTA